MLFIERERPQPPSRLKPWQRPQMRNLEVVDGLQRLTTLTILLCILRDLDPERPQYPRASRDRRRAGAKPRPRLSIGEPDEAFFLKHVRAPGATASCARATDLSPSQQRIVDVRDHLVAALTGYDLADRRRLAEFLLERCCMVQWSRHDIDQAHRLFEVLNATGKPLARNDILKAELLGSVPEASRPAVKALWDEAETRADSDFEQLSAISAPCTGRPKAR